MDALSGLPSYLPDNPDLVTIHLHNVRAAISTSLGALEEDFVLPLEDRLVPLRPEDLIELEAKSFCRQQSDILTACWFEMPPLPEFGRKTNFVNYSALEPRRVTCTIALMEPAPSILGVEAAIVCITTQIEGESDPFIHNVGVITLSELDAQIEEIESKVDSSAGDGEIYLGKWATQRRELLLLREETESFNTYHNDTQIPGELIRFQSNSKGRNKKGERRFRKNPRDVALIGRPVKGTMEFHTLKDYPTHGWDTVAEEELPHIPPLNRYEELIRRLDQQREEKDLLRRHRRVQS